MSQSDSSWRDRYYAANLDKVQAICLELINPKRQMLAVLKQVDTPATVPSQDRSCLGTPTSATSFQDPSPTSSTSTTSTSSFSNVSPGSITSYNSTQFSSLENSPTRPSPSPSNTSPTSPLPPVPILRCLTCGQAFKGVYRITNLQRHMRNTHIRRIKLVCPEPGCGIECSRTDNLRKHRRVVHGLIDKTTRQSAPKHDRRKI